MAKRFRGQNYPSVPQNRTYVPTRSAQKPPFYAEIDAASQWAVDDESWNAFVRDIIQMPETMKPAVQEAIRQQRWKIAPNPLASIRTAAHQEAKRMGLT
ncbi:MAG TPA: hypothetical protein VG273_13925 [Bryobacteraceae bacterium]|nr:hypothetical protein [Bryobacteraceae bacterium]